MGWEIFSSPDGKRHTLFCNTRDRAFGPVFWGNRTEVEAYLVEATKWTRDDTRADPRSYEDFELQDLAEAWHNLEI